MKISIIMPSYNAEATIEESIQSVIGQTHINWELLIYDDASSDNTISILKKYSEIDSRINVFYNNVNVGPGKNRNKAIKNSKGEYIAFLDSDDLWEKDKLSTQLNFMVDNELNFSHHAYKYFSNNKKVTSYSDKIFKSYQIDKIKYLTMRGYGYCNTFMFSKALKDKIIFNETEKVAEDFEAFLYFFYEGGKSLGIDKTLGYVRLSHFSRSFNKKKVFLFMFKFYLFKMKGNMVVNAFYFMLYIFNSFMHKFIINKKLLK